jgi:hypothetical protein
LGRGTKFDFFFFFAAEKASPVGDTAQPVIRCSDIGPGMTAEEVIDILVDTVRLMQQFAG